MSIPEGNLVLLQDYPEGCNKLQDCFRDQDFVVVEQFHKPNVYKIKPGNGVSLEQVVNCRQLHNLQKAHNHSGNTNDEEMGNIVLEHN